MFQRLRDLSSGSGRAWARLPVALRISDVKSEIMERGEISNGTACVRSHPAVPKLCSVRQCKAVDEVDSRPITVIDLHDLSVFSTAMGRGNIRPLRLSCVDCN